MRAAYDPRLERLKQNKAALVNRAHGTIRTEGKAFGEWWTPFVLGHKAGKSVPNSFLPLAKARPRMGLHLHAETRFPNSTEHKPQSRATTQKRARRRVLRRKAGQLTASLLRSAARSVGRLRDPRSDPHKQDYAARSSSDDLVKVEASEHD